MYLERSGRGSLSLSNQRRHPHPPSRLIPFKSILSEPRKLNQLKDLQGPAPAQFFGRRYWTIAQGSKSSFAFCNVTRALRSLSDLPLFRTNTYEGLYPARQDIQRTLSAGRAGQAMNSEAREVATTTSPQGLYQNPRDTKLLANRVTATFNPPFYKKSFVAIVILSLVYRLSRSRLMASGRTIHTIINLNPYANSFTMDYGTPQIEHFSPRQLSGYFESIVDNTQSAHDANTWMCTLATLQHQKNYLEALLSKTAITLNVLRDKQTRHERSLGFSPTTRSKKKKVQHQKWRTSKTIQTCENEERAILDCLGVCRRNIHTLESMLHPIVTSSTAADYDYTSSHSKTSYTDSADICFDWKNGWAEDGGISPFQQQCRRPLVMDDMPPKACFDGDTLVDKSSYTKRPPPLPTRTIVPPAVPALPVPPNTASSNNQYSTLSAEAESFEPSVTHYPPSDEILEMLDKLSISGFLASKRVQRLQRRRFSNAAIGHIFRRLSGGSGSNTARPQLAPLRKHASWGPDAAQHHFSRDCRPRAVDVEKDRAISV
ncbi:hypothetical protein BDV96DRAFT_209823 [Lophiotrema nucula]|uniref:Uncharacterized protein n=1 Tax=Lophiotrema nucula TaxID=690887 RepID=A0A6A5ZQ28_9PLEO|nr:hypothetical protein BDV96DRAFT_209823 [Lophiotrema nucula]